MLNYTSKFSKCCDKYVGDIKLCFYLFIFSLLSGEGKLFKFLIDKSSIIGSKIFNQKSIKK